MVTDLGFWEPGKTQVVDMSTAPQGTNSVAWDDNTNQPIFSGKEGAGYDANNGGLQTVTNGLYMNDTVTTFTMPGINAAAPGLLASDNSVYAHNATTNALNHLFDLPAGFVQTTAMAAYNLNGTDYINVGGFNAAGDAVVNEFLIGGTLVGSKNFSTDFGAQGIDGLTVSTTPNPTGYENVTMHALVNGKSGDFAPSGAAYETGQQLISINQVPEPSALMMVGLAAAGYALNRSRK